MLPSIAHPIRILASAPLQYSGTHRDMPKPLCTQCPNSTWLSRVCPEHSSKNPREIVSSVLFGPRDNRKTSSESPNKRELVVSSESRPFPIPTALLYSCRSALAIQWLTSASASGAGVTGSVVSAILLLVMYVTNLLLWWAWWVTSASALIDDDCCCDPFCVVAAWKLHTDFSANLFAVLFARSLCSWMYAKPADNNPNPNKLWFQFYRMKQPPRSAATVKYAW